MQKVTKSMSGSTPKTLFDHLLPLVIVVLVCTCSIAQAKPVGKAKADKVARGWLKKNPNPMESKIGNAPKTVRAFSDADGQILYYAINLDPAGFVILAADDDIEPVIAFSATGGYEGQQGSTLKALLEKDMKGRLEHIKNKDPKDKSKKTKWDGLYQAGDDEMIALAVQPSVSDVRVTPFTNTTWDQYDFNGSPCYNYYTPSNYLTGCVATAMAQLMKYHTWPTAGIGVKSFSIQVDYATQNRNTRGGNGLGGPYNWSQMPDQPDGTITTTQRQAIGALCHDAGVAVNMSYTSDSSSASLANTDTQLVNTFYYSNSIYGLGFPSSGGTQLMNMMNPNLDAQLPVILGIRRSGGYGHAVVADGYGYLSSAMYHHLNLGWGGSDNAWYQLPKIDTSAHTYTIIDDCVYNVYTSGTGEIISGRITNMAGAPLAGATVTARVGSTITKQTVTDSRGIYALINMPPNTQYRLSVASSGEAFADQYVTTGRSNDMSSTSGNKWQIDFGSSTESPPTAIDSQFDVISIEDANVILVALDDNLPDPNLLEIIITSLPQHGDLSEPNVGPIDAVPYTLIPKTNEVIYTPCPYFGGQDTFTFKADDGGTSPSGGESNTATVTANVDNKLYANFAENSNSYTYLMMDTSSFYDVRSQVIYLQGDIGQAMNLTDLALSVYIAPGRTLDNFTIRIQHTDWSVFSGYIPDLFLTSGWTTVYQGDVTFNTGWPNIHFQVPFEYNGTQNLLIDFSFNNDAKTSPSGGYFMQDVGSSRVLSLASSSGTHGNPLDWNFWALDGSYYLGAFVPSAKFIGEVLIDPLPGDFDATCDVKIPDIGILAAAWQTQQGQPNYNPTCDISSPKDNAININDLVVLLNNWMETYP